MPASRRRSTTVVVCAASAIGLIVSACSSSGSGSTKANSTPTTGTVAPSATSSAAPPSSGSSSGAASGGLAAACAAGESEGQLNFRDTTDPDVFAKEVQGFEEKYPKIKVNFGSQRPQDSVQNVVAQVQANHPLDVDAISIDFPSAGPLIKQGLIATVDWPSLGVPQSDVLTDETAQFVRTQRIMGTPDQVKTQLESLIEHTKADELMITTLVYGHENRVHILELLAQTFGLEGRAA